MAIEISLTYGGPLNLGPHLQVQIPLRNHQPYNRCDINGGVLAIEHGWC